MLETLLQKYDNRYEISKYSIYYGANISEVGFKKTATTLLTALSNPKPFLDGAIIGSILGFGVSLFSGENYLINTSVGAIGLGSINLQQYYFAILMDYTFDIFPKSN